MSVWICRPSLVKWKVDVNLGCAEMSSGSFPKDIHNTGMKIGNAQILDGDIILVVDTENIQKSLYEAFCDSGWNTGKNFNFRENDNFRAKEHDEYFDVYVNDKLIAKFYKDRQFMIGTTKKEDAEKIANKFNAVVETYDNSEVYLNIGDECE